MFRQLTKWSRHFHQPAQDSGFNPTQKRQLSVDIFFVAIFAEECEVNISIQPGDSSDATAIRISGTEHALGRAVEQIEIQFQAFADACPG